TAHLEHGAQREARADEGARCCGGSRMIARDTWRKLLSSLFVGFCALSVIAGTMMLTLIGSILAIPVGILSGVYASEYQGTGMAELVRFAADTLNGVPSIVIGVFVYGFAV